MSASNVILAQNVHVVKASAPVVHSQPSCNGEPRISIIKEGDIVRTIEVECVCGELIRLDCVY